MSEEKNYAPSKLVGEVKVNSKGNRYFFFGPNYCEIFTSKGGKDFVRATILPEKKEDDFNDFGSSSSDDGIKW